MSKDLLPFPPFKAGIYKHYKGGTYIAWKLARDCESPNKFMVVYQSTSTREHWIRSYEDFVSTVDVGSGLTDLRFQYVGDAFSNTLEFLRKTSDNKGLKE